MYYIRGSIFIGIAESVSLQKIPKLPTTPLSVQGGEMAVIHTSIECLTICMFVQKIVAILVCHTHMKKDTIPLSYSKQWKAGQEAGGWTTIYIHRH